MNANNQLVKKSSAFPRKGSALLVVLGMLSFMLFSGLAFSVFMRQSRLPTSFLRRTVSSRQLVKAALAEAIEHIDEAIGNDPHPGIRLNTKTFNEDELDNFWSHRVFFGQGQTSDSSGAKNTTTATYYPKFVDQDDTVATLTLEGLAYLPPNLINEARYYSRRTPTAQWHSFWFDSGRYAYTAIDVSDYFDVNRMFANKPRAACASRRVSFAHIFEQGADHSAVGTGAPLWETFMNQFRSVNDNTDEIDYTYAPFVSLADFNVAFGATRVSMKNPFYNYINDGRPYPDAGEAEDDTNGEIYRNMTFVTDGWYPSPSVNKTPGTQKEIRDLTTYQPFRLDELNSSRMPSMVNTIMGYSSDLINSSGNGADLANHLCGLGLVQLWDYLDVNRIPVSLAAPTLERVPMIVGLEITQLPKLTIKCETSGVDTPYDYNAGTPASQTQTFNYKILLDGAVGASLLAAYPFRKHGVDDSASFKVEARMALFFTVNGQTMTLRPGTSNSGLHLSSTLANNNNNSVENNSVISFALTGESVNGSDIAQNEAQPVKKLSLRGNVTDVAEIPFFNVKYSWNTEPVAPTPPATRWTFTYEDATAALANESGSGLQRDSSVTLASFKGLMADGSVSPDFAAGFVTAIKSGIGLKVNAAIWARVTYSDEDMGNKTVDLVPACAADDDELNGANNTDSRANMIGGDPYPLMRFDVKAGDTSTFTIQEQTQANQAAYDLSIDNPRIICNDPRYNHQPENWYTISGSGLQEQDWIDETAKMLGGDGRDPDVFMFTSDAGYMQSVYELAFLPRLTGLTYATKNNGWWGNYNTTLPNRDTFATSWSDAKDKDIMWRTYRCYDSPSGDADPFEQIGLVCGDNGLKANPYSDNKKMLMAALANTPHDWRVTATNEQYAVLSKSERTTAVTFNKEHAWNAYSKDQTGRICWDCLEDFADRLKANVRNESVQSNARSPSEALSSGKLSLWEEAFASLYWASDKRKLLDSMDQLDSEDSDLYSVDKKFLYGFWHDSFSARQQLFLIFVRAEPMMMGGGVSGQTPPQLGGRAVALVWRDPTPTVDRSETSDSGATLAAPHHTRILFYHQFD